MTVRVAIEKNGDKFYATATNPFPVSAEGETEAEALANYKSAITKRLPSVRYADVELPEEITEHNLDEEAKQRAAWDYGKGIFRNDLTFDAWQEAMREYRRERDKDDDTEQ